MTDQEELRKQFERDYRKEPYDGYKPVLRHTFDRDGDGFYSHEEVEIAFYGYVLRAESAPIEITRLRQILKQTHQTYCVDRGWEPGHHAPECLAHEVEQ